RIAEFVHDAHLDLAAQLRGHGLHAVADAEHGDVGIPHGLRRGRRIGLEHGLGAAGEDDSLRIERAHGVIAGIPGMDLAIDAELAHAARDELGVLRSEVEDQDAVRVDVGVRGWAHGSRGASKAGGLGPPRGPRKPAILMPAEWARDSEAAAGTRRPWLASSSFTFASIFGRSTSP